MRAMPRAHRLCCDERHPRAIERVPLTRFQNVVDHVSFFGDLHAATIDANGRGLAVRYAEHVADSHDRRCHGTRSCPCAIPPYSYKPYVIDVQKAKFGTFVQLTPEEAKCPTSQPRCVMR